jgi:hypothetical protein
MGRAIIGKAPDVPAITQAIAKDGEVAPGHRRERRQQAQGGTAEKVLRVKGFHQQLRTNQMKVSMSKNRTGWRSKL